MYSLCMLHLDQYYEVFKSCYQFFFSSFHPASSDFNLCPCNFKRIIFGFFKKTLLFFSMIFDRNPTSFIPVYYVQVDLHSFSDSFSCPAYVIFAILTSSTFPVQFSISLWTSFFLHLKF